MKTIRAKVYSPILMLVALVSFIGCGDSRLTEVERLLETDVKAADSILSSMPMPTSRRDLAWYAVLKTQADYKQRKTFTSDSLITTATFFYGTSRKGTKARRYQSALAWYSQGCVYSELNNDYAAIDAYLKAKDLFPDTLIRYYALAEQNLGTLYLDRMMLEQSINQLNCCKINAVRLGNTKMSNYAFVRLGLSALYGRDFKTSDSIFTVVLNDNSFSNSHKTLAKLQMSKIKLYNDRNYNDALLFVDSYINDMKQASDPGTGYSVKADIYYEMNKYDSAYHYYKESMKYDIELYTRCSNADRLAELTTLFYDDESLLWHRLYGELRDSINNVERKHEIEELQYQHKEIMVKEKYAHRHRIIIIIYSSVLLIVVVILLFIYSMFKHREKERILKKRQELQIEEEKIRKSTIELLESKIKAYSIHDPEARTVLLKSYSNRLKMCTNAFVATPEYKLLCSYKLNVKELNKDEKEALFYQIKRSYMEAFTDFQNEVPGISENDILTIILKYQSLSVEHISSLFSITTDSVKKRLYRLSQRVSSDFLDIYSI